MILCLISDHFPPNICKFYDAVMRYNMIWITYRCQRDVQGQNTAKKYQNMHILILPNFHGWSFSLIGGVFKAIKNWILRFLSVQCLSLNIFLIWLDFLNFWSDIRRFCLISDFFCHIRCFFVWCQTFFVISDVFGLISDVFGLISDSWRGMFVTKILFLMVSFYIWHEASWVSKED